MTQQKIMFAFDRRATRLPLLAGAILVAAFGCVHKKKGKDEPKDPPAAADNGQVVDPHADLPAAATELPHPEATPGEAPFSCLIPKTPREFVSSLTADMFRRGPTDEELKAADDPALDRVKAVDHLLASSEVDTGIAYFVSNLLRIEQNLPVDADERDAAKITLLNDLKQEPVVLVQRSRDKPWPSLFTTRDVYCTSRTASLYGYPVDKTIAGFVACKLPAERAGLLGLVSFLRAFSSAYNLPNNNRHRVATALYLAQGLQLAAKTDGPTGEGRPLPLAACVPEIDTRVSATGLAFGTAAVPKIGSTCAGCHSRYLGPMEPAFLRFGPQGETLELTDVDQLDEDDTQGIPRETLKNILQYGNASCWAPDDLDAPPQDYTGLPGLGRLIAGSSRLGKALSIQIQQNLVNHAPEEAITKAIVASYEAGGKSLNAALKGFFLSAPYGCSKRASP